MSDLSRAKSLYLIVADSGDIRGIWTSQKAATEATFEGDEIHVFPVSSVNSPVRAQSYTPPSAAIVTYAAGEFDDIENYALTEEEYVQNAGNALMEEPDYSEELKQSYRDALAEVKSRETFNVKVITEKDKILKKLEEDLGVTEEDEWPAEEPLNDEDDYVYEDAVVTPAPPTGGFLRYNQQGEASGQVEFFSPV